MKCNFNILKKKNYFYVISNNTLIFLFLNIQTDKKVKMYI